MQIKESELKLLTLRVTHLFVDCKVPDAPVVEEESKQGVPEIEFNISRKVDEDIIRVLIEITGSPFESQGYDFRCAGLGFFSLPNSIDSVRSDKLVLFSAVPLVIGFLRERLSEVTAQSLYGRYLLPAIDMVDLIKNWQINGSAEEQNNSQLS